MTDESGAALSRGYSKFRVGVDAANLTTNGANWLRVALDPFHDFQVMCEGLPDTASQPSLVHHVKRSFTVTRNPALPLAPWDANFSMDGHLTPINLQRGAIASDALLTGGGPVNNTYHAMNCAQATTGAATFYNDVANVLLLDHWTGVDPGNEYLQSEFRLIAAGFEVHNQSAIDLATGSVVYYRLAHEREVHMATYSAPAIVYPHTDIMRMPPSTQATAIILPGSVQDNAIEGAYCVATQDPDQNYFISAGTHSRQIGSSEILFGIPPAVSPARPVYIDGNLFNAQAFNPNTNQPYDISGAYFSGLNVDAVLTCTAHWYIERSPTMSDPDITAATPSAGYDGNAFEMYSRIIQVLPAGVRVSENPFGEWFDKVMSFFAGIAPKVGNMVGQAFGAGEIGQTLGGLAGQGLGYLGHANAAARKRQRYE